MSVAVIVAIMAMSVPVISFIVTMAMVIAIVAAAVVAVVFVLAVVMAVVMADFFAIFVAVKAFFPTAMATPVCMFAADWVGTMVAEARVIGAVDIAAKSDGSVEPGTCSEEDSAREPCGAVIAKRGTSVGGIVVVAVRTDRLDTDVDGNLHLSPGGSGREAEKREKGKREKPHEFQFDSPW